LSEISSHGACRTTDQGIAGASNQDFNIAETSTVPPGLSIIVGPDDGVDHGKEIDSNQDCDHCTSSNILGAEQSDEWDVIHDNDDSGEDYQEDGIDADRIEDWLCRGVHLKSSSFCVILREL